MLCESETFQGPKHALSQTTHACFHGFLHSKVFQIPIHKQCNYGVQSWIFTSRFHIRSILPRWQTESFCLTSLWVVLHALLQLTIDNLSFLAQKSANYTLPQCKQIKTFDSVWLLFAIFVCSMHQMVSKLTVGETTVHSFISIFLIACLNV